MSRLDQAARSVPADSSPAPNPDLDTTDDLAAETTPPEGDPGTSNEPGNKKERTVDNVRGELLRKMDAKHEALLAEIHALREDAMRNREQYGVPTQQPAETPQTLDDMSIAQLEAARMNVPEEQRAQFDAYLADRKLDLKLEERVNEKLSVRERQTAEERFNAQAFDRWPQLRDKSSPFYQKADHILTQMGRAADTNPRAVLDAANEAGLELGLAPNAGLRPRREPGRPVPGRTSSAPPSAREETAELDPAVTQALADAMPGGKFSPEALKRIQEGTKLYQDTANTRVKG